METREQMAFVGEFLAHRAQNNDARVDDIHEDDDDDDDNEDDNNDDNNRVASASLPIAVRK